MMAYLCKSLRDLDQANETPRVFNADSSILEIEECMKEKVKKFWYVKSDKLHRGNAFLGNYF